MPPLAIILPPLGIYGVIFNKCIVTDEYNFTYTAILLPFLFHMSIIASRSSSESISGDSIAIFIKLDRLESLRQLLRRVLINFIWEKLLSTDAVETGRVRLMVASVLKFGNMAFNISFEANSFNWSFMFLGGCGVRKCSAGYRE